MAKLGYIPTINISTPVGYATGGDAWRRYWTSQYQAVYDAMNPKPSQVDALNQSKLMKDLVDGGYFAKADLLDVFACDTSANSLINWKNPGTYNPSLVSTPTFTAYQGFKPATNKNVRTNFIPSTNGVNFTKNSGCVMIGVGDDRINNISDFGSRRDDGGKRCQIESLYTGNVARFGLNNDTFQTRENLDAVKHYAMSRSLAANFDSYLNKSKQNFSALSTDVSDKELYVGGAYASGVTYNVRTVRYLFIFSYLTESEVGAVMDIVDAYLSNYHTNLINYNEYIVKPYKATKAAVSLTTYEASGQTCHPSVVSTGVWNNYKYWMANTPLPGGDATKENPSIWGSNDGTTWVVPAGLTNPVIAKPAGGSDFNADPDLFFDANKLYLLWKQSISGVQTIKISSSSNGVTWSEAKTVLSCDVDEAVCVSPSLIKINGRYYIYYFSYTSTATDGRVRRVSCDTIDGTYGTREAITAPIDTGYVWWHLSIKYLSGSFWMPALRANGNNFGEFIYLLKSSDGLNFTKSPYPTIQARNSNEALGLYRPTLEIIEGQGVIYYGCVSHPASADVWATNKINVDLK